MNLRPIPLLFMRVSFRTSFLSLFIRNHSAKDVLIDGFQNPSAVHGLIQVEGGNKQYIIKTFLNDTLMQEKKILLFTCFFQVL